jgi:uridine kinase
MKSMSSSMYTTLPEVIHRIQSKRSEIPRTLLVALSGIDGSGKGYCTKQIASELTQPNLRVANINIDGWLELPDKRFSKERPGAHFYEKGIRFREMFDQLVLPLKEKGTHRIEANLADATNANEYHRHLYEFEKIDIILLEGIFLFKKEFRDYYDLTVWIDCTFETGLERALQRNQEGLSEAEIRRDYDTIYYAAQRIHFEIDHPQKYADMIIQNDHRLDSVSIS